MPMKYLQSLELHTRFQEDLDFACCLAEENYAESMSKSCHEEDTRDQESIRNTIYDSLALVTAACRFFHRMSEVCISLLHAHAYTRQPASCLDGP